MRRFGQLGFLEIGVDPDFRQRTDHHQRLTGLHVIARVDVAARDHAIDLGKNVAVAQVQLGLFQISLGLEHLGVGLLDRRGFADELGIDAIQIALWIAVQNSWTICFGGASYDEGTMPSGAVLCSKSASAWRTVEKF